jgi:hypothetical protein
MSLLTLLEEQTVLVEEHPYDAFLDGIMLLKNSSVKPSASACRAMEWCGWENY